jgi:hypothetical protein
MAITRDRVIKALVVQINHLVKRKNKQKRSVLLQVHHLSRKYFNHLSHHAGNAMLTSPLLKACQQNLSSYALEALLHDFFKAKFPNH